MKVRYLYCTAVEVKEAVEFSELYDKPESLETLLSYLVVEGALCHLYTVNSSICQLFGLLLLPSFQVRGN